MSKSTNQPRTRCACAVRKMKRAAREAGLPLKVYARKKGAEHNPRTPEAQAAGLWLGRKLFGWHA